MLDIKFNKKNSKKIARVNFYVILVYFLLFFLVFLFWNINKFPLSLMCLIAVFIFLFLSVIILFYSKIELNDNIIIIKSPFIINSWMFPQSFLASLHVVVDINNIQEIKFDSVTYFFIEEKIAIIYYLLPGGTKSKVAVSQLIFPNFKNILNEILKIKPDLKITYKKDNNKIN